MAYSGHILYLLPFFGIRNGARQPDGPLNAWRHSFSKSKEVRFAFCPLNLPFVTVGLQGPKVRRIVNISYIVRLAGNILLPLFPPLYKRTLRYDGGIHVLHK